MTALKGDKQSIRKQMQEIGRQVDRLDGATYTLHGHITAGTLPNQPMPGIRRYLETIQ